MTRLHLVLALSAGMMAVGAQAQTAGEIGYTRGSLGYDAIVSGDLRTAETQIENARDIDAADPARLINLGYIYMRTGRTSQARAMFETVRAMREPVELVLASGETVDTQTLARRALAMLAQTLAQR